MAAKKKLKVVEDFTNENVEEEDFPEFSIKDTPEQEQFRSLARVSESFDGWRPAAEVLTAVLAVQTDFIQYDRATRVNGHPVERFGLVHGPSGHGKTTFCHGLGLSFVKRGHFYAFVDAEYTTPEDWLRKLMGKYASYPGFVALRPESYEETVDKVRSLVKAIRDARDRGEIQTRTTALVVIDSLRKLVPEKIWDKVMKGTSSKGKGGKEDKSGGVDGMSGRSGQVRAAMNGAWLDELTPMLYHTKTTMMAIQRESEDVEADANDRKYGNDWKLQGGKAIYFDSSMVVRVVRSGWIREGSGEDSKIIGEKHKLLIHKTKVAGMDGKATIAFFNTSNGSIIPEGFDYARDALDLAVEYKIVEQSGSSYSWRNCKWRGINNAVKALTLAPEGLAKLQRDVRERFSPDEVLPEEMVHNAP